MFCGGTRTAKEVAYVIAGRLIQQYQDFCLFRGIKFTRIDSVRPHDHTTLFCSAGMQQYKPLFLDLSHIGTVANSQACLRMGDLDEIGDGTHFLQFTMLGLFSFREMTVGDAIDFWLEFLATLGLLPDHVTIHPDRLEEWAPLYRGHIPIVTDDECTWSDGNITGYCTEFYKVAGEIGNQSVPLAEEFALCTAELSYLSDRRIAYENLAIRTGLESVKSVSTALIQAERYGTPLGTALRVLAQESRDQRMSAAEKKAAALPPKLTVPMILFFLPVLFVIIIAPALVQVFHWK